RSCRFPAAETIRVRLATVGGAARTACHGFWKDACEAVGRRDASPSGQELPRSATPIAKIGSKGPRDRAARTCRSLTLRSAFRRIAFVPLYRRKALLAGPVHDNKKHANTDRPHEPKDELRTLEPGAWQPEDRRRLERHHHHRLVSDQPTEGDRRAGRKQH